MTKIYLIRHAESEGNTYRRAHGHYNGQITATGHMQIEQLRQRFANETIDVIYSSDLDRAVTTAKSLSEPRNLPVNKCKNLREVDLGAWEDQAWGDLEHNEPEMIIYFNSDPSLWKTDGSESLESVISRMSKIIYEIGENHEGQTVAVFSHGFAIRSLMCELTGVCPSDTHKVPYFDNTAVALLTFNNGDISVEYQGDNSHLNDEISTFARQTWWREGHEQVKENLRYEQIKSNSDDFILNPTMQEIIQKINFDIGYIAFLDNEPVGFLALDNSDDNIGKIMYYYVKPEYRQRNFHEQLIGHALAVFRMRRKIAVQIDLTSDNKKVIDFLRKHGFEVKSYIDNRNLLEYKIK